MGSVGFYLARLARPQCAVYFRLLGFHYSKLKGKSKLGDRVRSRGGQAQEIRNFLSLGRLSKESSRFPCDRFSGRLLHLVVRRCCCSHLCCLLSRRHPLHHRHRWFSPGSS